MEKIELYKAELSELLQKTGDGIADMFEQYLKGSWRDDHGHDVGMNITMVNLQKVLTDLMEFRYEYLGYSDPVDKRNLM